MLSRYATKQAGTNGKSGQRLVIALNKPGSISVATDIEAGSLDELESEARAKWGDGEMKQTGHNRWEWVQ